MVSAVCQERRPESTTACECPLRPPKAKYSATTCMPGMCSCAVIIRVSIPVHEHNILRRRPGDREHIDDMAAALSDGGGVTVNSDGLPFDLALHALNVLDGKRYRHHPVLRQVRQRVYPLEKENLVELNGLRVPAKYDCDIFNNGSSWGSNWYFFEVPTRWLACRQHLAAIDSGLLYESPALPMVDDEYAEHVAVYHSVQRAHALATRRARAGNAVGEARGRPFVFAELGARWGTWAGRAGAYARSLGLPFKLLLVEASRIHCNGIQQVLALNDLRGFAKVHCGLAEASHLRRWVSASSPVDAMDIDIQGAELELVPSLIECACRARASTTSLPCGCCVPALGPAHACEGPSAHIRSTRRAPP